MKRMLSFISAIALTTTLVQATSVESQNIVGYHSLPLLPNNFEMVAVNWEEIGGDEIHIQDLFLDPIDQGLVAGVDPGGGDVIWVWNGLGYDRYFLYIDEEFPSPDLDGKWLTFGYAVADVFLPKGKTFWLQHRGTDPIDVTVAGQVPLAATVDVPILANNFSMIGSAFSAGLELNSGIDWKAAGATPGTDPGEGDVIWVWNGLGYDRYFFYEDELYPSPDLDQKWLTFGYAVTDYVLPMGKGAWYQSRNSSPWNLTQQKPY